MRTKWGIGPRPGGDDPEDTEVDRGVAEIGVESVTS